MMREKVCVMKQLNNHEQTRTTKKQAHTIESAQWFWWKELNNHQQPETTRNNHEQKENAQWRWFRSSYWESAPNTCPRTPRHWQHLGRRGETNTAQKNVWAPRLSAATSGWRARDCATSQTSSKELSKEYELSKIIVRNENDQQCIGQKLRIVKRIQIVKNNCQN